MRKTQKISRILFLTALGLFFLIGHLSSQQTAEELFEKAMVMEEAQGDLQKAIGLYEQILKQFPENDVIAGKAQLHIGLCYEKLGRSEAIKAYELVLEKYAGQKELVAVARARLAELKHDKPAGLLVVDLDFYVPQYSLQPFDLSPDGTKMLGVEMIKGQNIVVCDLESQKVEYITDYDWSSDSSWTYNPIWSPDGEEIAFSANNEDSEGRRLMKSTLEGPPQVLLSNEKYWYYPNAWMPDGKAILTIRGEYKDNTQELGLVPSDGGEFQRLVYLQGNVTTSGGSRAPACVSPDGRFIAFMNNVPSGGSDIFIMSPDGNTSWPLIEHPAEEKFPRWSPDGKHVIFLSFRHGSWALWGVKVDKGKAVGHPFIIREGTKDLKLLNWTSNGLACWNAIEIYDIYLMDVNPKTGEPFGNPRLLGYTPTGGNRHPVWSPDGDYLAFVRTDDNSGKSYVNVIKMDDSASREFPVPEGYRRGYLRWEPEGKEIGMISRNIEGKNFLLRLDLSSKKWDTTLIPVKQSWSRFEWSGNGMGYIYSKNGLVEQGAGIYEHDLETGKDRLIYHNQERYANFRWLKCSRDYKWLAFLESNRKVMVVNRETGENHLAAIDVGYPSWSPDGKTILATRSLGFERKENLKSMFVFSSSAGPVKEYDLSKSLPNESRLMTHDWSPNGKQIVFYLRQNKSDVQLYKNIIPKDK
jgi:Tol biopolymer transport system component